MLAASRCGGPRLPGRRGARGELGNELPDVRGAETGRKVVSGPRRESGQDPGQRVVADHDVVEVLVVQPGVAREGIERRRYEPERRLRLAATELVRKSDDRSPLRSPCARTADHAVPAAEND